jgi:hypothetical protein
VTPNDFQRFKAVMAGMGRVFGADVDSVLLDAYWLALRDWTLTDFEGAAARLMQTCHYMPKPADFAELRRAAMEQTAGDAWARVLETIRRMSPRETAKIDPKIDSVVRQMGGYGHLACMTTEELPWRMKRFIELWAEHGEVEEARAALPHAARLSGPRIAADGLAGLIERRQ